MIQEVYIVIYNVHLMYEYHYKGGGVRLLYTVYCMNMEDGEELHPLLPNPAFPYFIC